MSPTTRAIERLINTLAKLPSIGPKAAERIVYHLLGQPAERTRDLGQAITALPETVRRCSRCGTFDTESPCAICGDRRRDQTLLCVVAQPTDVRAIEKTKEYQGLYHVLHGLVNPIEGVSPSDLSIQTLVDRIAKGREHFREVLLALSPTVEGETTALYLAKALKPLRVRVTKLARGLPMGGEVEYADEMTLSDAIRGRSVIP